MSTYRTYFSKNNTIFFRNRVNTARNPVIELTYGNSDKINYSRFLFDLDFDYLNKLKSEKKIIINGCDREIKHTLRMKNTSSFDEELINSNWSNGNKRASSFTLILFRIPTQSSAEHWDEGVGYDLETYGSFGETDKNFSKVPSNWFSANTTNQWDEPGIYNNSVKFSGNVETFKNSNAGGIYSDGSFIGVNGIAWSYIESRDANNDANNSGIDLPALMLRRSSNNSKILSSVISGGIRDFSVKLYKGFTGSGDRQVELFINGISKGVSEPFDNFDEQIFTVENINVSGDFTLEIRNITPNQVIVDDISWTSFSPAPSNDNMNYSNLTIIDTQNFEIGNEDISFDMTSEINDILTEQITKPLGWGIAFTPNLENISSQEMDYSVGFFSKYTQTFYEPYLETDYNDYIEDNRYDFSVNRENKLYLYVQKNNDFISLDEEPILDIKQNGNTIPELSQISTCEVVKGIYEATIPSFNLEDTPCVLKDVWSNLKYQNNTIPNIENNFTVKSMDNYFNIGSTMKEEEYYNYNINGIRQQEDLRIGDVRKININLNKKYSKDIVNSNIFYRLYVKEGTTEVVVDDWTKLSYNGKDYFFILNTEDKIPNEYFIDFKIENNFNVDISKRQIKFNIVNEKTS